jgi:hypothetical protein
MAPLINYIYCLSIFRSPVNTCNFHWHRTRIKSILDEDRGPGSSVGGIATHYWLDAPRIESRWGARLFVHVQTGPGAHPVSCTMGTWSFLGVKRPGRGADHPSPSSAEVENEKSYTSTPPPGLWWPV